MKNPVRTAVLVTIVAAAAVFASVQDRETRSGVLHYVTLQRRAMSGQERAVTIDQIMRPAVAASIRQGLLWGAVVLIGGLGAVAVVVGRSRS